MRGEQRRRIVDAVAHHERLDALCIPLGDVGSLFSGRDARLGRDASNAAANEVTGVAWSPDNISTLNLSCFSARIAASTSGRSTALNAKRASTRSVLRKDHGAVVFGASAFPLAQAC